MFRSKYLFFIFLCCFYGTCYCLVRLPVSSLYLSFLDDGETLYHTLSLLEGQVPFRDNFNHHFIGYLFPFVLVSKLFGYSIDIIFYTALLHKCLLGLFVYLLANQFAGMRISILAGLLAVIAREPWVLGFFPQQEINLLMVIIWLFSISAIRHKSDSYLSLASLTAGLAFVYDQRALLLAIIPFATFFIISKKAIIFRALKPLICFAICPALFILYLKYNQALSPFWEQTFVFPFTYRSGSSSLLNYLVNIIQIHSTVFYKTPFLLLGGLIGFFLYLRNVQKELYLFWGTALVPLIVMPSLGGRDFEYYSLTWNPFLALFAALSLNYISSLSKVNKLQIKVVIVAILLMPSITLGKHLFQNELGNYKDDGISEVVDYLNSAVKSNDSIYVYGYRLEILARLKRLSHLPFASDIMISPDSGIKGRDRLKHVYPKYEGIFKDKFLADLPNYIVSFSMEGNEKSILTKSEKLVEKTIKNRYGLAFEKAGKTFTGKVCEYKVFHLKDK